MNASDELKYSYSAKPRAVQTSRSKALKSDGERSAVAGFPSKPAPPNIMYDPRVARGSVFAPRALISPRSSNNEKPKKRRSSSDSKKPKESLLVPHKVASYAFAPFSLEENLVEKPREVTERESFSQTDEFVRYLTPKKPMATADGKFQRPKVGIDSGTQIEDSDKLFNFDAEVKPLLNVLVSKTLAQALAEIKEEQEMANIIHERKVLLGNKADIERLDQEFENKAKAALRAKEQTKKANEIKRRRIKRMQEKVLAWQLAHSTIVPDAYAQTTKLLEQRGVFYNPMHRDLAQWLGREVFFGSDAKLRLRALASTLLDDLLLNALRRQSILVQLLPSEEHEALVRINLRDPVVVRTESSEDVESDGTKEISVLGPIALSRNDSLELIEQKLQAWVHENVGADVTIPVGGILPLLALHSSI